MKLTIESDGTRKGTRLLADGEEVENVSAIEWRFNQASEFVTATITVEEVGLNVKPDCAKEVL